MLSLLYKYIIAITSVVTDVCTRKRWFPECIASSVKFVVEPFFKSRASVKWRFSWIQFCGNSLRRVPSCTPEHKAKSITTEMRDVCVGELNPPALNPLNKHFEPSVKLFCNRWSCYESKQRTYFLIHWHNQQMFALCWYFIGRTVLPYRFIPLHLVS